MVPTRWSNSSDSRNFRASPQDCVSGQTQFSVGDITWPTRSLDRAVPDYFLWGYVKNNVYETRPTNIADLKQWIQEIIQGIPKELLQRVMTAFALRLQECIEWHGGHLQSVTFKKWLRWILMDMECTP